MNEQHVQVKTHRKKNVSLVLKTKRRVILYTFTQQGRKRKKGFSEINVMVKVMGR